jgi:maintenance of mitochondrial morphology protein 1
MLPNFTLDLKSTSLLGSRAKLADVPKLHELIDNQLRRALSRWGTLKFVLPGFSDRDDMKERDLMSR